LDTSRYGSTVAPLASSAATRSAVADRVSAALVSGGASPRAQAEVAQAAQGVLASDAFAQLWKETPSVRGVAVIAGVAAAGIVAAFFLPAGAR
jgi:hypothetical protein